jgi:hypothetical protein
MKTNDPKMTKTAAVRSTAGFGIKVIKVNNGFIFGTLELFPSASLRTLFSQLARHRRGACLAKRQIDKAMTEARGGLRLVFDRLSAGICISLYDGVIVANTPGSPNDRTQRRRASGVRYETRARSRRSLQ